MKKKFTPRVSTKHHPTDVHVGRRVRIRRTLLGMSQTALAEALGLTFQQLQKYESGDNRISCSRIWRISEVLGEPVEWFFMGVEGEAAADDYVRTGRDTIETVRYLERCSPLVRKRFRALALAMAESTYQVPMAAE